MRFSCCALEERCICEEQNGVEVVSTVRYTPQVETILKSVENVLIVVIHPPLICLRIDLYSWHWYKFKVRWYVILLKNHGSAINNG